MSTIAPVVIARVFQAPPQLLFRVFMEPQHLAQWLSPEGFVNIHTDMDFRVGGRYHYGIQGPNDLAMWGRQDYLDITPNEKLVHLQSFSTPEGGLGAHPMAPTWPKYMLVTTTFDVVPDEGTRVTITWLPHNSDDTGMQTFDMARSGMTAGFAGTFLKLDAYLAKLQT
jgi:uncharacterized protein YndB with AHSA1/START domain